MEDIYEDRVAFSIDREISEEEGILSIAEEWGTTQPPTQDMLQNSYYKQVFAKIKWEKVFVKRPNWNKAAAFFNVFWLFYIRIYGLFFLTCALITSIFFIGLSVIEIVCVQFSLYILLFLLLGYYGNVMVFKQSAKLFKKGYAFWNRWGKPPSIVTLYTPGPFERLVYSLIHRTITPFFIRIAKKEYLKKFAHYESSRKTYFDNKKSRGAKTPRQMVLF